MRRDRAATAPAGAAHGIRGPPLQPPPVPEPGRRPARAPSTTLNTIRCASNGHRNHSGSGTSGREPTSGSGLLGAPGALLGLGDGPGGVDQVYVTERLREVADHLAVAGVDLLGEQADVVDGGDGALERRGGRF